MNKLILSLILFFVGVPSIFAQITLGPSNNYEVGTVFTYNNSTIGDLTTFDPGGAGSNVSWDYSQIASGNSRSITMRDPLDVPNHELYPSATTASNEDNFQSFFVSSSTAESFLGVFADGGAELIYDDPQDFIRYPMTYNDSFTDEFAGTINTNVLFDRKGTTEVSCDAYGTLITPAGTFNDVIRVKSILSYGDFTGSVEVFHYEEVRYFWYNAIEKDALLAVTLADYGLSKFTSISYLESSSTAIKNPVVANSFNIFPNPATDHFQIDLNEFNAQELSLIITNAVGQGIYQHQNLGELSFGNSALINLPTLENGSYFITLFKANELVGREKLMVLKD